MAKKSLLLIVLVSLILSLALGRWYCTKRSADQATTEATTEATAPSISEVVATDITATSANIEWTTDEPATGQVEYGTTADYGSATALAEDLTTAHAEKLDGLSPQTTYHFSVKSKDESNNEAVSGDSTFSTTEIGAPVISRVTVADITISSAKVTWATDEPATSQVEYGPTTTYGTATKLDRNLGRDHTVQLSGLTAGAMYHFRVKSRDADKVGAVSADYTFFIPTAAMNMMKRVPRSAHQLFFGDLKGVRADRDLKDLYAHYSAQYGSIFSMGGADIDDADYLCAVTMGKGTVCLAEGRFDLNQVRSALRTYLSTPGSYNGVELWTMPLGAGAVAMQTGLIILSSDSASVRDCIDVIQGEKSSLYDDANLKEMALKLGRGVVIYLEAGTYNSTPYAGLLVSGSSVRKRNATTMEVTVACKFNTVASAALAAGTGPFKGARRDGQCLQWTRITSIADFIKK